MSSSSTAHLRDHLNGTPAEFREALVKSGARRAMLANRGIIQEAASDRTAPPRYDENELLEVDARGVSPVGISLPDIAGHEAVFFEVGKRTGQLFSVSSHRTLRGPGGGGIRLWGYDTFGQMVTDGLRLARGMSHKSALAGLNWGGGKGIVYKDPAESHRWEDKAFRKEVFNDYGDFITSLHGIYYAAEDVGLNVDDLDSVFERTRFTTCISPALGGSGNPSGPTAKGVVAAMEGALDFLGRGTLSGKTVAMQGAGNVSDVMIEEIMKRGGRVKATDIDENRIQYVMAKFGGDQFTASMCPRGDNSILTVEADIVAPNALGGVLNPSTIPKIQAPIVCGAANNQLLDPVHDDRLIFESGKFLYIPDFVANRMGIVNCADEAFGSMAGGLEDEKNTRHFDQTWENSVFRVARDVSAQARELNQPTGETALKMAEAKTLEPHPIWPSRFRKITASLVLSGWVKS